MYGHWFQLLIVSASFCLREMNAGFQEEEHGQLSAKRDKLAGIFRDKTIADTSQMMIDKITICD